MAIAQHLSRLVLFLLLLCGPLPWCLALVSSRRRPGAAERLAILLAAWCILQTHVALGLGALHCLSPTGLLISELSLLGSGVLFLRWRGHGAPPFAAASLFRGNPLAGVTVIAVSLVGITLIWWTATVPILDWDSWAFHLPAMVQWLQAGSFVRQDQFLSEVQGAYPYSWEAICALFMIAFGEDFLVTLPNLFAWVLLGLATYLLSRDLGARRIHALASAVLLMTLPTVVSQINSMHVDVPFASIFLVSAFFALHYGRTGLRTYLALCVLCLGLLAGIRTTGPIYVAFVFAFLLLVRGLHGRQPAAAALDRSSLLIGCGVTLSFLFLATFWYARNWIDLGNPIGLMRVDLFGVTLFPGPISSNGFWETTLAHSFAPLRPSAWKTIILRTRGELGLPFAALTVMAAGWLTSMAAPKRFLAKGNGLTLVVLLIGTLAVFMITPYGDVTSIQIRLGFPFIGILAVAAATGATASGLRDEIPTALAAVSVALSVPDSKVLVVSAVALIAWGLVRGTSLGVRPRIAGRAGAVTAASALLVVIAAGTFMGRERREQKRSEFFGELHAYLKDQAGDDAPLGHLFTRRPYLLYGPHLRRKLIYTPFPPDGSVQAWADRLRQQGISLVAIGPDGPRERIQETLALLEAPRGPLVPVLEAYTIKLYRLSDDR